METKKKSCSHCFRRAKTVQWRARHYAFYCKPCFLRLVAKSRKATQTAGSPAKEDDMTPKTDLQKAAEAEAAFAAWRKAAAEADAAAADAAAPADGGGK